MTTKHEPVPNTQVHALLMINHISNLVRHLQVIHEDGDTRQVQEDILTQLNNDERLTGDDLQNVLSFIRWIQGDM
jgi:hypothetical protein